MRVAPIPALALLLLCLVGCGGAHEEGKDSATVPVAEGSSIPSTTTRAGSLVPGEGEVLLTGTLGCGHCNFHVGTTCSAALKTADGDLYILDVADESPLFQDRFSGRPVQVVGKVLADDDPPHVAVARFTIRS